MAYVTTFLLLLGVMLGTCAPPKKYVDKLLIVSMDGFRWDYLNLTATPNFEAMAANGVSVPYVNNTFATKTFPCHFTMVTGLFEETHGIISNHMWDPIFKETFSTRTHDTKWWDGGEPIWVTATKQRLKSATFFWPGSEVRIRGHRPDIWKPYVESTPFRTRVNTVLNWFTMQNVNVATLYFHEPDATGHAYGPRSQEIVRKVADMDGILGYLYAKLRENNLLDKVNVIVTSDHGMAEIDVNNRVIDIPSLVNMSLIQLVPDKGAVTHILPYPGKEDEVIHSLQHPRWTVYRKEDIPDFFHFKNNRRVMPVVAVADEGWVATTNKAELVSEAEHGTHGYDNQLQDMKPIFFARGPNFKRNHRGQPIKSVDIYPLMCELLGISPSPNNGSLARVRDFLVPFHDIQPVG